MNLLVAFLGLLTVVSIALNYYGRTLLLAVFFAVAMATIPMPHGLFVGLASAVILVRLIYQAIDFAFAEENSLPALWEAIFQEMKASPSEARQAVQMGLRPWAVRNIADLRLQLHDRMQPYRSLLFVPGRRWLQ